MLGTIPLMLMNLANRLIPNPIRHPAEMHSAAIRMSGEVRFIRGGDVGPFGRKVEGGVFALRASLDAFDPQLRTGSFGHLPDVRDIRGHDGVPAADGAFYHGDIDDVIVARLSG